MEGENRLRGDPAARSRSASGGGGSWAEACLGERRGKASRPPPSRVRGGMALRPSRALREGSSPAGQDRRRAWWPTAREPGPTGTRPWSRQLLSCQVSAERLSCGRDFDRSSAIRRGSWRLNDELPAGRRPIADCFGLIRRAMSDVRAVGVAAATVIANDCALAGPASR